MEVNRHISIYEKNGGEYIGEIPLNNLKLSDLIPLITVDKSKDDYFLYNCYLLDETILAELAILDNQTFELDLDNYEYYLEATEK